MARPRRSRRSLVALVLALLAAAPAGAATITVVNLDAPGEGFNDPTPVPAVGGNPCGTLGAQRLRALRLAADIWADRLPSNVEIRVGAQFDPLFCSGGTGVLGQAGPQTVVRDFAGAPLPNTYYVVALANALAGTDLDPGGNDINAFFNTDIDTGCISGLAFYYGLDANPPSPDDVDFASVALHELAHGLGFLSLVDAASGAKLLGRDDAYMLHLEDHSTGTLWPIMTDAERAASALDTGDLHWTGATAVAASGVLVDGRHPSGHIEMFAPSPLRPGSSVSHWTNDCTPNEVMEPAYTEPTQDPGLADELMRDLGWPALQCGDGTVQSTEGCDDGDTTDGDGCSHRCAVEQCWTCAGGPSVCSPVVDGSPCDDDDACTQTDTCQAGVCTGANPVDCGSPDPCIGPASCDACSGECGIGLPTCIDPFLCYTVRSTLGSPRFVAETGITLADAYEPGGITVSATKPKHLCNPADIGGGTLDTATHLESYKMKANLGTPRFTTQTGVEVANALNAPGSMILDVSKRELLMVPAAKDLNFDPPAPVFAGHEVDHYKCYKVKTTRGTPKFPKTLTATVSDQFTTPKTFAVKKPKLLCAPVDENAQSIKHPAVYQTCYQVKPALGEPRHTPVAGVFVSQSLEPPDERFDTKKEDLLCVPSVLVP